MCIALWLAIKMSYSGNSIIPRDKSNANKGMACKRMDLLKKVRRISWWSGCRLWSAGTINRSEALWAITYRTWGCWLNSFDRAEPYLKYLESLKLPKFDIKKEFADNNNVCLLYELPVGTPPVTSFVCAWFHVGDDRKISSLRVIFDPRPYLQQK
jgi:hypothetical protein